jgi:hypothetical protein
MYLSEYTHVYLSIYQCIYPSIYQSVNLCICVKKDRDRLNVSYVHNRASECLLGNTYLHSLVNFFLRRAPSDSKIVVSEYMFPATRVVEFARCHFRNRKEDAIPNELLCAVSS